MITVKFRGGNIFVARDPGLVIDIQGKMNANI